VCIVEYSLLPASTRDDHRGDLWWVRERKKPDRDHDGEDKDTGEDLNEDSGDDFNRRQGQAR
jgi:hypothetical protein